MLKTKKLRANQQHINHKAARWPLAKGPNIYKQSIVFKNQNLSVYGGPGQNEWEASGSAFSSLREKKHGAQLNHGHAQKRDVPFRPLNFSLFRFFCFKTKEMKSLPGLRAKRILLALPTAGGTSFFSTARLPAGRLKKGSIPMAIGSRGCQKMRLFCCKARAGADMLSVPTTPAAVRNAAGSRILS
jgi:hypothetical protein